MSQQYAFEPFSTLQDVLNGQPIRIMPLGTFYRDERCELKITPDVLQQMAANFKQGLPRFRVPINENHEGMGKVGTVEDVAFLQDGADGPGLYATKYELSDIGKQLITDKRFDAVSPEVVWSLNDGAQYQDPNTGKLHDNVLIGLALTDRPFFGHDNVALFSATPHGREVMSDMPDKIDQVLEMLQQLGDEFAVWTTASINTLPDSCFLYIESGGENCRSSNTYAVVLRG